MHRKKHSQCNVPADADAINFNKNTVCMVRSMRINEPFFMSTIKLIKDLILFKIKKNNNNFITTSMQCLNKRDKHFLFVIFINFVLVHSYCRLIHMLREVFLYRIYCMVLSIRNENAIATQFY